MVIFIHLHKTRNTFIRTLRKASRHGDKYTLYHRNFRFRETVPAEPPRFIFTSWVTMTQSVSFVSLWFHLHQLDIYDSIRSYWTPTIQSWPYSICTICDTTIQSVPDGFRIQSVPFRSHKSIWTCWVTTHSALVGLVRLIPYQMGSYNSVRTRTSRVMNTIHFLCFIQTHEHSYLTGHERQLPLCKEPPQKSSTTLHGTWPRFNTHTYILCSLQVTWGSHARDTKIV